MEPTTTKKSLVILVKPINIAMDLLDQIKNLHLDYLDHGWVKTIYQSEFLDYCDLPAEYESAIESVDLSSTFENIVMSTDQWLNSEAIPSEQKSWASISKLMQKDKVLAIVGYYIHYGCNSVHIKEYRTNALLASRVYFKLLTIPGCKAYHIYHSQLFAQSLACLRFPIEMCDEASSFNAKTLTKEVNIVLEQLSEFVKDLAVVVEHLHLNPFDLNFEEILSNLVDITEYAIVDKLQVDKLILEQISKMVYKIIHTLLCDPTGESNEYSLQFLFKCILPRLLASCSDSRNTNRYIGPSYVTYSFVLLATHGMAALNSYMCLLEHLSTSPEGLERGDVRESRSKLIVGMMSSLPQASYKEFVIWLIDLTRSLKVSHRQVAVEILAKVLDGEHEEDEPEVGALKSDDEQNPQPSHDQIAKVPAEQENNIMNTAMADEDHGNLLRERKHKVLHLQMLRAIFDRANDESGTLRTRSLVILTKLLTSKHVPLINAIEHLNGSGAVSRMMAVATRNSNDERAAVRKAAAGLLQQLLGQHLARPGPPPLMQGELTFLVSLCHDASIIVRSAAITGLGELLAMQPCEPVLDAFLEGPLHQVSDPETKVQEQVLSLIEKLLINRLRKFSSIGSEDPMPWKFLAGIARRKKMKNLQKVCLKLKKSTKCINHRLVDILSTHLGAVDDERDVQCLLLLTSVAHHVDYTDLGFVFDYYYKLSENEQNLKSMSGSYRRHLVSFYAEKNERKAQRNAVRTLTGALDLPENEFLENFKMSKEMVQYLCLELSQDLSPSTSQGLPVLVIFRDMRLMKLTLDLLGSWSRFMGAHEKTQLRHHLVQRLAAAQNNACRILCIQLAYELCPDNLTWATEMMQMSERRAVVTGDVTEAVRAADLSLSAPVRPSPDLLNVFLSVVKPPPDWDGTRRSTAVTGALRLCLRARDVAATCAPVFASLLARVSEPLAVRINALVALSDICARYTCIVEPLLGIMSDCLSENSPVLLRRMGTRELTRLLLGGYLRLRTPLYYRYCGLLADEDGEVREPVEYYVTCGLTVDVIYHHFVECVLHYNHDQKNLINFDNRQLIYDVMLQRMTLVQKLNIQCRLAREVLEHAADLTDEGDEELPSGMNAALLDTITLLCGPRMKLPKRPQKSGELNGIDDLQERVTTNIVSHKMKIQVAEVLVPAVLRLYTRLRPRGGQINTYLVQLANDLLKDYEQEIKELLEDNEELMKSVQVFQSTIGVQVTFGNVRNLVTGTAPPSPDTPRARRRPAPRSGAGPPRSGAGPPRKRALRI